MTAGAVLAFYFLFASPASEIRIKERAPDFDKTGVSYHQKLLDIDAPACVPNNYYQDLPWTEDSLSDRIKTNKVHVMRCNHYSVERYNEEREWKFDKSGQLLRYAEFRNYRQSVPCYTKDYTYDEEGYLTSAVMYLLEDGISKQYNGYEKTSTINYSWSDDHRVCKVAAEGKLKSLPGTGKKMREAWDNSWSAEEYWEFDDQHRPLLYRGLYLKHQCEILFRYTSEGLLFDRAVQFKDCSGGFKDSIAWEHSDGLVGRHYFALSAGGKRTLLRLLETLRFDGWGNLIDLTREAGVTFAGDKYREVGGSNLMCSYYRTDILSAIEIDSNYNHVTHRRFMYQMIDGKIKISTLLLQADSLGFATDTLRMIEAYKHQNGLINFIDVTNHRTNFGGSWNCPSYHDLDRKCVWEFTYEYF